MSAGTKQINAMLGKLMAHADRFGNWAVADIQHIFNNPTEAIEDWRQMIIDRRRKMVIPTSNRTDATASFVLNVGGRVDTLSLYNNTDLCDPNKVIFDHTSRELIMDHRVLDRSHFSELERDVSFKTMTLGDFGFTEHVETGLFMNDEFLKAWSRKHYDGYTLSLCKDLDFLFFIVHSIEKRLDFGEGITVCPIFAMRPVHHWSSGALYVFAVQAAKGIDARSIIAIAAHNERPHNLVQRFVFRITPNAPKSRPKRK